MRIAYTFILCCLILSACTDNSETSKILTKDYPKSEVEMKLIKVSDNAYYVQGVPGIATDNEGFISNAGFIVSKNGVVVFDALGTPSLAVKLLKLIRTVTDKPVTKVIVSHYHADHVYGLQIFKEIGAQIIAPKGALDYLNSPVAIERLEERKFSLEPWVNESTKLLAPDLIIDKTMKFKQDGLTFTLDVLGAAHSEGDLTLYIEPDRVLFSGDIIFEGRIPYLGDSNTQNWLMTLQELETSKLVALIPGHGPAAKNPNQAISLTRHYLQKVRSAMGKAVANFEDFAVVYDKTDWSDFEKLPAFEQANRRNAYQVFLSMEQE